jgi:peptide/nickel transport system substrate-binding protein
MMNRRSVLAAGAAALAAPRIARAQAAGRVLRFAPQANLANLDPIWGTQYVVRNASALIWDTLYGIDSNLEIKPQMCAGHETSADGLTWTFTLRRGLKFHDGSPVTPADVIASINRWAVRDPLGQLLKARTDTLEPVGDMGFRFRLKRPFSKMLFALGKNNTPVLFIMPARIAATDPFQQITEYVGSGPMRFVRNEWVPGSLAAFERFADYVPREEAADWLAGGKRMGFDRIEWRILPDPGTAAAALQNGEIDWWETPLPDLVPQLRRNRNVAVDIADPFGNIGAFRFNHLHAPFNDVRARRAIQMALNQEDYMRAVVGSDDALWKALPSFFTPDTPFYTEAGGDILKGPRNIEGARRLLAESGYNGQPITVLVGTDQAPLNAMGQVTNALLRSLGMNVDYVATDWGTVGQRRAQRTPPGQGGWHIFHTWHAGADCITPASYSAIRTHGDGAWFGWPNNADIERAIATWFDAPDQATEKAAMEQVNRLSMEFATWVPTGFYRGYQAWRRNLNGVVKGPLPFFWGVTRA